MASAFQKCRRECFALTAVRVVVGVALKVVLVHIPAMPGPLAHAGPFNPIPESVDSNPSLAALRRLIALRGSGVIYYILPWLAHYMHMDVPK